MALLRNGCCVEQGHRSLLLLSANVMYNFTWAQTATTIYDYFKATVIVTYPTTACLNMQMLQRPDCCNVPQTLSSTIYE